MLFDVLPGPGTTDQPDPRFDESLMRYAASHGPCASVWQSAQGLVVPRTYCRAPDFDAVAQAFSARGWPVHVRHSGGGVVPQGPGVLNVSLSYAIEGRPLDHSDRAYEQLCALMAAALAPFGIHARSRAVEGSFCDGRYNLACTVDGQDRKIAGTAQLWRRQPTRDDSGHVQVVLVHGLMLVRVDIDAVTAAANALESALGHARCYQVERAVSMDSLLASPGASLVDDVKATLLASLSAPASAARSC